MEIFISFITDYGLFLAKALTILIFLILVINAIAGTKKTKPKGFIQVKSLNNKFDDIERNLKKDLLDKKSFKLFLKQQKSKKQNNSKKLFILDFVGNIKASEVESLREEITAIILASESSNDEVLIRLENAGGTVHEHGLAASQILRLKKNKIKVTISVDKVAASGGYMMACTGNKILAAPFSIIGSIGVIAQIPNLNRLLKEKGVDFEQHTAGKYKRTVTMFGKTTDQDRKKLKDQLENIHTLFKNFISKERPKVDIENVATGEYWFGSDAIKLKLVDEIITSDEYILLKKNDYDLINIKYNFPKTFGEKISSLSSRAFNSIYDNISQKIFEKNIFK